MGLYDEIAKLYLHPGDSYDVSQVPGAISDLAEAFPKTNNALTALLPGYAAVRAGGAVVSGIGDAIKKQAAQDAAQSAGEAAKLKAQAGKTNRIQKPPVDAESPTSVPVTTPGEQMPPQVMAQYTPKGSNSRITVDYAGGVNRQVQAPSSIGQHEVLSSPGSDEFQAREAVEQLGRRQAVAQATSDALQAQNQAEFHKLPIQEQLRVQKEAALSGTVPGASYAAAENVVGDRQEYVKREKQARLDAYKAAGKQPPSDAILEHDLNNAWLDAMNKTMEAIKGRNNPLS